MDADAFMLYDAFIYIVSILKSNYLEKMTSGFLMSNGVIVNHSNDETDFYDIFNEVNLMLGTENTCEIFFQDAKIPYQNDIISSPTIDVSHIFCYMEK